MTSMQDAMNHLQAWIQWVSFEPREVIFYQKKSVLARYNNVIYDMILFPLL